MAVTSDTTRTFAAGVPVIEGRLAEVFLSVQGEGTHVGRPQVFVRLGGCPLRCRYCDSPEALVPQPRYRVALANGESREALNPVLPQTVAELVDEADPSGMAKEISITGGEPLAQPAFLEKTLPLLSPRRVFLETAGIHDEELGRVLSWVDTVSMDLKLPSVTRERDCLEEHERFLQIAARKEVIVKVVISPSLDLEELRVASRMVARRDRGIPFVLQPETNRTSGQPASGPWIMDAMGVATEALQDVRLIPQTHRFMGLD